MKISVVTASYNQGVYISEAIISIIDQEFDNIEHIIIDNESTDNTKEVINSFKNYSHIKFISEPDSGQSNALNKGIRLASGDWILWLNSDDKLNPGAISSFLKALQDKPDADVVYGHTDFIDEYGNQIRTVYHIPYNYYYTVFGLYAPPSTGTFFRTSVLRSNLLNEDYHYRMDIEWFLRCGKNIKTKLIDRTLSSFRVTPTNKTGDQIRTGKVPAQHQKERDLDRKDHVYPQIKYVPKKIKPLIYRAIAIILKMPYYFSKFRYSRNISKNFVSNNQKK